MKDVCSERRGVILCGMVPMTMLICTFSFIPILYALYISFHEWSFVDKPTFVGFGNYVRALKLGSDPLFYRSVANTFWFVLLTVPVSNALAIFVASLIAKSGKWEPYFRMLFFMPVITNLVAITLLWRTFYDASSSGLFNVLLSFVGIPNQAWLQDVNLAMICVALMSIWHGMGYSVILYTAGFKNIPKQFHDAAKIDGASILQEFWHVTIPLLMPTISFCLIIGTIGALQMFVQVLMLTRGEPLNATLTVVYHLYTVAFDYFDMGYACAMAFVLFIIIMCFTMIQFRLTKSKWEY